MTDEPLVLPLDDPNADIPTTGGKGASLATLGRAGLPVPPGFHVTTHAYRRFTATTDPHDPTTYTRDLPPDIEAAIRAAHHDGTPVAVRSSATAEDLPTASFAGQHTTHLNVTTTDDVITAIKDCWASLWSPRATAYRAHNNIPDTDIAMAVVVQALTPADAAGVLFTTDPVTGNPNHIVINAAWGLGEAVVAGTVTPDTYTVERTTHRELTRHIADKTTMTTRTPNGTEETDVPTAQRTAPTLTPAHTTTLATLAEQAETLYNTPLDIEWARHGDTIVLLQARPITTHPSTVDTPSTTPPPAQAASGGEAAHLGRTAPDEEATDPSQAGTKEGTTSLGHTHLPPHTSTPNETSTPSHAGAPSQTRTSNETTTANQASTPDETGISNQASTTNQTSPRAASPERTTSSQVTTPPNTPSTGRATPSGRAATPNPGTTPGRATPSERTATLNQATTSGSTTARPTPPVQDTPAQAPIPATTPDQATASNQAIAASPPIPSNGTATPDRTTPDPEATAHLATPRQAPGPDQTPAETWNDSTTGDFLWTSANLGEAIPNVMTPATWSLVRRVSPEDFAHIPVAGNIGGRFYLNLSAMLAAGGALGMGEFVRRSTELTIGRIPDTLAVPTLPMSRPRVITTAITSAVPFIRDAIGYRARLRALVSDVPGRCRDLNARIADATTPTDLTRIWDADLLPLLREANRTLAAGARVDMPAATKLRRALTELVGETDTNAIMTGLHEPTAELASLGPVLGLARYHRGDIDRDTYLDAWGHRCADEFELSAPRPAEDPTWLDRQPDPGDPETLLANQTRARDEAWDRLTRRDPHAATRLRPRLDHAARAAREREQGRSELVRVFGVIRAWLLRVGTLTHHGEDIFFLTLDETVDLLDGDTDALAAIPARRAAYDRYRALPPYPTLIRGRFDPETWAADPHRRTDVYDATATHQPADDTTEITGFPGAAGTVEGLARVITNVDDGHLLHEGEVLVTTVTNIGWTPLFPRAAAVVTDVGAPLSHAAIVARELGIPAVVGCGTATTRIATGDRVRVNGAEGTVTLLSPPR